MQCQEFERLEQSFVDLHHERLERVTKETLASEAEARLRRAELQALVEVFDHAIEHACQGRVPVKLPASRNLGGIIGPY